MTDIFISYARSDIKKAEQIINRLNKESYNLWWDQYIDGGQAAHKVIWHHLREAKYVIVLWSVQSLNSNWVIGEAQEAYERKNIIPVFIESVKLQPPFNVLQTFDLTENMPKIEELVSLLKELIETPNENYQNIHYIDNGNGTITDNTTQLMWLKFPITRNTHIWKDAIALSTKCNIGGYKDWRLPTTKELLTIVEQNQINNINSLFFPHTANNKFWSSTSYSASHIEVIDFSKANMQPHLKSDRGYARYVRYV